MVKDWVDPEDDEPKSKQGPGVRLKDFDCPQCNASNPCDEVVPPKGVEIRCNYCGVEFKVTHTGERFKFKEL